MNTKKTAGKTANSKDQGALVKNLDDEIYEIIQELYDQGLLVKEVDDKGQPVLELDSAGELQPVFRHLVYATQEDLDFWRNEHPGKVPTVPLRFLN